MRTISLQVIMLLGTLVLGSAFAQTAVAQDFDPAQTFQTRCAGCHTIGGGQLVGPDLKGVTERRPEDWLIKFIRNSQALVKAGDPVAVELFNQFNQIPMPEHEFTDNQTRGILKYISAQSAGGAAQPKAAAAPVEEVESGHLTVSLIGDNQGYQPEQPIAFSHKRHAGDNKLPCLYCHFGAEKSRHAGIPPVNTCMNCHKFIMKDSPEVAKIYKAVDEGKAIEWVKVHKLPDFAYFNHAQHVAVGKLACQTCHGPVQDMVRMRQVAPMTMGWCVQCHRDTDVAVHGRDESGQPKIMKVSDQGGLDCTKCHY